MTELTEGEKKFFSSRGAEVDSSLAAPETPKTEAPAAETAAPTPAPAAAPAPAARETPPPQQVPLQALHEERQKRSRVEAERAQLAAELERLRAQAAPEAPDPQSDPLGALAFQSQRLTAEMEAMRQWRAQQEQGEQRRQTFEQFTQHVMAAENAYRATTPDYEQAAAYALAQYDKLLSASFPDPLQRQQQIRMEAANALARAVSQGRNPAEFVYQFAKSMGYAPAAPAAAPAAPAAPAPASNEVVKAIEKGLKHAASLAQGGSTAPTEMTPEQLLALNGEEFTKAWGRAFRH